MKFNELKKYLGIFILAVAIIVVYKTFDNFNNILGFLNNVLVILNPFFIGGSIAFVLFSPCKKFEELFSKSKIAFVKKYRRGISVLSMYAIVAIVIALILLAIIPQLTESIKKFALQLPDMVNSINYQLDSLGIPSSGSDKLRNALTVDKLIGDINPDNINKYAKSVMSIGSSVVNIFIGLIISIYILIERSYIKKVFLRFINSFIAEKPRNTFLYYTKRIADFIQRYIVCQLLDAVIVFILCLIALTIMRNDYAALIALMVGSFNLIPYFGAIVAVVIAALLTLVTNGFIPAVILVVVLIVLQQIDANIIQPRLVSNSLSIKPLLVIFGVIVGGGLFGIIGMFIGVPVVALINDIVTDIIDKKNAEKATAVPEDNSSPPNS